VRVRELCSGCQRYVAPSDQSSGKPRVGHAGQFRCAPASPAPADAHSSPRDRFAQLSPMTSISKRLERGQRGADLGAEQHRAGGLDGDLTEQRQLHARPAFIARRAPLTAAFAWSRVLRRLDKLRHAHRRRSSRHLRLVRVAERGVRRVTEVGSFVPGPTDPMTQRGRFRRSSDQRQPRRQVGRPPRPTRRCGQRSRTRPSWRGWRRRCWSPPRRSRRRSTRRGHRGPRPAG